MTRVSGAFVLSAAAVLAAGSGSAQPDAPPAKGPADLQGCWRLVSVEIDGDERDPLGGGLPRWVVKGDTVYYGGAAMARLATDAKTAPKILDLRFSDPDRVYEGVYTVEKDTLKVCLNARADKKDRPAGFATKGEPGRRLLEFAREKKAPADPLAGLTGFVGIKLRGDKDTKAVVVDAPVKGSPAEKAGLKAADVVLRIGGEAAGDVEGTVRVVRAAAPGTKLEIQVRRDGKERTVTVPVGVFPFHLAIGLE